MFFGAAGRHTGSRLHILDDSGHAGWFERLDRYAYNQHD
jgi:hypothetical protein